MKKTFKVEIGSPEIVPKEKDPPNVLKYVPVCGLYFASEKDCDGFAYTIYQLIFFICFDVLICEIIYRI